GDVLAAELRVELTLHPRLLLPEPLRLVEGLGGLLVEGVLVGGVGRRRFVGLLRLVVARLLDDDPLLAGRGLRLGGGGASAATEGEGKTKGDEASRVHVFSLPRRASLTFR